MTTHEVPAGARTVQESVYRASAALPAAGAYSTATRAGSSCDVAKVTLGSAVSCPRYLRVRAVGIDGRAWTDAEVAS